MAAASEIVRSASDVSVTGAFACENVSTDMTGRVTFHSVTEQLTGIQFPGGTARLFAVFAFLRTAPGLLIANRIEVAGPSGGIIALMEFQDVVFRSDQLSQRMTCNLGGIVWPAPGDYAVRFVSRGAIVATIPLRVVQVQSMGQSQ